MAIDDQSIQKLGRWPWPRAYVAELIDAVNEGKPSLIATNILFTEADRNSGLEEVRAIRKQIEDGGRIDARLNGVLGALNQAERRLDNDAFLGESISRAKNVLLPMYFIPGQQPDTRADIPDQLKKSSLNAPDFISFQSASEQSLPIKPFLQGASAFGHLNLFADADGTLRRETLFIRYGSQIFPSFALQAALA